MFVLRFYFDILMKGSMFLAHLWLVTCGGLDRLLSTSVCCRFLNVLSFGSVNCY